MVRRVLSGEAGPARNVVVLNAGAALVVAGAAPDLAAGIKICSETIDSGRARAKLAELAAFRA